MSTPKNTPATLTEEEKKQQRAKRKEQSRQEKDKKINAAANKMVLNYQDGHYSSDVILKYSHALKKADPENLRRAAERPLLQYLILESYHRSVLDDLRKFQTPTDSHIAWMILQAHSPQLTQDYTALLQEKLSQHPNQPIQLGPLSLNPSFFDRSFYQSPLAIRNTLPGDYPLSTDFLPAAMLIACSHSNTYEVQDRYNNISRIHHREEGELVDHIQLIHTKISDFIAPLYPLIGQNQTYHTTIFLDYEKFALPMPSILSFITYLAQYSRHDLGIVDWQRAIKLLQHITLLDKKNPSAPHSDDGLCRFMAALNIDFTHDTKNQMNKTEMKAIEMMLEITSSCLKKDHFLSHPLSSSLDLQNLIFYHQNIPGYTQRKEEQKSTTQDRHNLIATLNALQRSKTYIEKNEIGEKFEKEISSLNKKIKIIEKKLLIQSDIQLTPAHFFAAHCLTKHHPWAQEYVPVFTAWLKQQPQDKQDQIILFGLHQWMNMIEKQQKEEYSIDKQRKKIEKNISFIQTFVENIRDFVSPERFSLMLMTALNCQLQDQQIYNGSFNMYLQTEPGYGYRQNLDHHPIMMPHQHLFHHLEILMKNFDQFPLVHQIPDFEKHFEAILDYALEEKQKIQYSIFDQLKRLTYGEKNGNISKNNSVNKYNPFLDADVLSKWAQNFAPTLNKRIAEAEEMIQKNINTIYSLQKETWSEQIQQKISLFNQPTMPSQAINQFNKNLQEIFNVSANGQLTLRNRKNEAETLDAAKAMLESLMINLEVQKNQNVAEKVNQISTLNKRKI